MRFVYLTLIVVFTAVLALFMVQNLPPVTVRFLSAQITLPLFLLILGFYVLGMLTGGLLFKLLASWFRGSQGRR